MNTAHRANAENLAEQRRKNLLARMAGNIASGIALGAAGVNNESMRGEIADAAVDIAERILQRIGL